MEEQLEKLLETVNEGTIFLKGELPALAREILHYGAVRHLFFIGLTMSLVAVALYFIYRVWKEPRYDTDDKIVGCVFLSLLASIPFSIGVIQLVQLIKVLVAPRLYLLECIKGLL